MDNDTLNERFNDLEVDISDVADCLEWAKDSILEEEDGVKIRNQMIPLLKVLSRRLLAISEETNTLRSDAMKLIPGEEE